MSCEKKCAITFCITCPMMSLDLDLFGFFFWVALTDFLWCWAVPYWCWLCVLIRDETNQVLGPCSGGSNVPISQFQKGGVPHFWPNIQYPDSKKPISKGLKFESIIRPILKSESRILPFLRFWYRIRQITLGLKHSYMTTHKLRQCPSVQLLVT